MTQRGTTHTLPWQQRLTWPLAVSLVLHGAVMAVRPPAVRFPSLPVEINRTVEFGLETARPATSTSPPAPPPHAALAPDRALAAASGGGSASLGASGERASRSPRDAAEGALALS